MRFGVLSFTHAPFGELVERWRWFEALGFDVAWVADELFAQPGLFEFEAWTTLGALARETRGIRIGTLVSTLPFRHPTFLAAQALTLDHVSGGRAMVGFGSGAGDPEFNALVGHGEWTPAERADRFEEQVVVLSSLLRGEPVDHAGPHYPALVPAAPAPVQRPRPPLILAAHGPRGLGLVARHADGWSSFGGQPYGPPRRPETDAVAATMRLASRLDEACAEAGREPGDISRSILAFAVDPDPFVSLDRFDEYVGGYAEIGIDEIDFFWPPRGHFRPGDPPVPGAHVATLERVAAERFSGRSGSAASGR
jgi:alkanesulfonate monooxygenase SsuD/methylene tetrahydromethanopterin reductase-like flavin-dependent oxidoreductase (luciferase family)